MKNIAETISQLIREQFPEVYRQEGDQFIAFIEAYYKYLETGDNSTVEYRQMGKNADIDDALDEFVIHFKKKYLADFPYISTTNTRFVVKHIMDYYRAKGSELGLELLMRLMFSEEIQVYYPKEDVFRLSNSIWKEVQYIELDHDKNNLKFLGKFIRNKTSYIYGDAQNRKCQASLVGDGVTKTFNLTIPVNNANEIAVYSGVNEIDPTKYNIAGQKIYFINYVPKLGEKINVRKDFGEGTTQYRSASGYVESIVTKNINGRRLDVMYMSSVEGEFHARDVIQDGDGTQAEILGSLTAMSIDRSEPGYRLGDVLTDAKGARVRVTGLANVPGRVTFSANTVGHGYTLAETGPLANETLVSDTIIGSNTVGLDIRDDDPVWQNAEKIIIGTSTNIFENVKVFDRIYGFDASNNMIANAVVYSAKDCLENGELISPGRKILVTSSAPGNFIFGETLSTANGSASGTLVMKDSTSLVMENIIGSFATGDVLTGQVSGVSANVFSTSPAMEIVAVCDSGSFTPKYNLTLTDEFVSNNETVSMENSVYAENDCEKSLTIGHYFTQQETANTFYTLSDTFTGDGFRKMFTQSMELSQLRFWVLLDGVQTQDFTFDGNVITFDTAPAIGVNIEVRMIDTRSDNKTTFAGKITDKGFLEFASANGITANTTITGADGQTATVESVVNDRVYYTGASATFPANSDVTIAGTPFTIDKTAIKIGPHTQVYDVAESFHCDGESFTVTALYDAVTGETGKVERLSNTSFDVTFANTIFEVSANTNMIGEMSRQAFTPSVVTVKGLDEVRMSYTGSSGVLNSFESLASRGYVIGTTEKEIGVVLTSGERFYENSNGLIKAYIQRGANTISVPVLTATRGDSATFNATALDPAYPTLEFTLLDSSFNGLNVAGIPIQYLKLDGSNSGCRYVETVSVSSGGTGYVIGDILVSTGGGIDGESVPSGAVIEVTGVSSGAITTFDLINPGFGFVTAPTFIGGSGTGATFDVTISDNYGFVSNFDAGLDSFIFESMTPHTATFGSVSNVTTTFTGNDYDVRPLAKIRNRLRTDYLGKFRVFLNNSEPTVSDFFAVNDTIYDEDGTPFAIMTEMVQNGVEQYIELEMRLPIASFPQTFYDSTQFDPDKTEFSVASVQRLSNSLDVLGDNFDVNAAIFVANNTVANVAIYDSGFGYSEGDSLSLDDGKVTATATESGIGIGEGYWQTDDSHLSATARVHDNDYYQTYSYDVISGVSLNRYKKILESVFHVAGTKLFGTLARKTGINTSTALTDTVYTGTTETFNFDMPRLPPGYLYVIDQYGGSFVKDSKGDYAVTKVIDPVVIHSGYMAVIMATSTYFVTSNGEIVTYDGHYVTVESGSELLGEADVDAYLIDENDRIVISM